MSSEIGKTISELYKGTDFSKMLTPDTFIPANNYAAIVEQLDIKPSSKIIDEISGKMEEQNKLASQQMKILVEQNNLLKSNYAKLEELYNTQEAAFKATQEELSKSRRYNVVMMIIALIAMLAAIAGPIVTFIVSKQ